MKILNFIKYISKDVYHEIKLRKQGIKKFKHYGLRLYSGAQGAGKTVSLVEQLERYREEYPNLFIATNFGWDKEDYSLSTLEDIIELPKKVRKEGYNGLVIGWDEIQNDFDNSVRTFPISVLRTITQQRKQNIQMLATSQVFTRVAKPIREQTYQVVECRTVLGRWTYQRWYDPVEYEWFIANPDLKNKLNTTNKYNFIQTDELRDSFNSYAVIDSLDKVIDMDKKLSAKRA